MATLAVIEYPRGARMAGTVKSLSPSPARARSREELLQAPLPRGGGRMDRPAGEALARRAEVGQLPHRQLVLREPPRLDVLRRSVERLAKKLRWTMARDTTSAVSAN